MTRSILERFQKHDTPRVSTCRWVDRRHMQTFGPDSKRRKIIHCNMEREATVRKQLEACLERESVHPILPSHQTRKRPFQAMDMEYLIRVIFVLVGMDRIAILVDLFKIVRTTNEFDFLFLRGVLQATGRDNSTPHRELFTHANFARAWRKAQVAAISLSQQQSFSRACYVSHFA